MPNKKNLSQSGADNNYSSVQILMLTPDFLTYNRNGPVQCNILLSNISAQKIYTFTEC